MPSQGDQLVARKLENSFKKNATVSEPDPSMLHSRNVSSDALMQGPAASGVRRQRRQSKGMLHKLSRDAQDFIPVGTPQIAAFTKSTDLIHDRVGYLRPDLEEKVPRPPLHYTCLRPSDLRLPQFTPIIAGEEVALESQKMTKF